MEISLITRIACIDSRQRDFILEVLSGSTSIIEDGLRVDELSWFQALEDIEISENAIKSGKNFIHASWLATDVDSHRETMSSLERCGVKDVYAAIFGDEGWCMKGTKDELRWDALFIPNSPAQYLWDYVSYSLEYHGLEERLKNKEEPHYLQWFIQLIAEILSFEDRADVSTRRPSTIALVERLRGKYERKEFSDSMMRLWEEARQNIKKLKEQSRVIFQFGIPEDKWTSELKRQGKNPKSFTSEIRSARMALWTLI